MTKYANNVGIDEILRVSCPKQNKKRSTSSMNELGDILH